MNTLKGIPERTVDVHQQPLPHLLIHRSVQLLQLQLGMLLVQLNNRGWSLRHLQTPNSFLLFLLFVSQLKEILKFHGVEDLLFQRSKLLLDDYGVHSSSEFEIVEPV
jgi:hypothetical protein